MIFWIWYPKRDFEIKFNVNQKNHINIYINVLLLNGNEGDKLYFVIAINILVNPFSFNV